MAYILTGLIIGLVLSFCLITAFYFGYKLGSKTKPKVQAINEETKRKAEQFQKDFQAVMNYDVNKALQRRKV